MGKPGDSLEKLYDKHDCNGITVWVDSNIDENSAKEIKVGYRKFLFWGELTISGISSRVIIQ